MRAFGRLHRAARHAALAALTHPFEHKESPASAGLFRVLLTAALLLGGCAVGGGGDEDERAFPQDLAEPAQPLTLDVGSGSSTTTSPAPGGGPATTSTTSARSGSGGVTSSTAAPIGEGGSAAATTTTLRPFRQVASVADRAGDAGIQARPYGDLALLRVEDDGVQARITVQAHGDLPTQPAEGEVIGIGVDVYRGGDDEGDYQLFALGNADGWWAALQEGDDWVAYPGRFELGGSTVVFTVPWSSIGGRGRGAVSVFEDWSHARVVVVADESSDRAPGQGTQAFSV